MAGFVEMAAFLGISVELLIALILIGIWDGIWKLIAMWKSAKKKSVAWFIILAIFNTAGILPILYIYLFSELKLDNKTKRKRR